MISFKIELSHMKPFPSCLKELMHGKLASNGLKVFRSQSINTEDRRPGNNIQMVQDQDILHVFLMCLLKSREIQLLSTDTFRAFTVWDITWMCADW